MHAKEQNCSVSKYKTSQLIFRILTFRSFRDITEVLDLPVDIDKKNAYNQILNDPVVTTKTCNYNYTNPKSKNIGYEKDNF